MKLYVGNLSWGMTDEGLRKAFEQYGTVESATVLKDRETGRSRGFGFVDMPVESEARAAIEAWDGVMLDGRSLRVNEATPREQGRNRGRGNGGCGGHGGHRNGHGGHGNRGGFRRNRHYGNRGFRDDDQEDRGDRGDRGGYGRW